MTFEEELRGLINKHSRENNSGTPDFILAQFMNSCLHNFGDAMQQREEWYGRKTAPVNPIKDAVEKARGSGWHLTEQTRALDTEVKP